MRRTAMTAVACLMLSSPALTRPAHRHHHRRPHRIVRDLGFPVLAGNNEVRINAQGEVISQPASTPGLDQVTRERGMKYKGPSY